MKLLLVITIFLWSIVVPVWAHTIYPFYLPTLDAYSRSVTGLRDLVKLKDKHKKEVTCFGEPMLDEEKKFILVELRAEVTITLTIHQKTLYVEGYSDRYNGHCRTFVFIADSTTPHGVAKSLCSGEKKVIHETLGYTTQYSAIEAKAGEKKDVQIGINVVKEHMKSIYGIENPDVKIQAQFILCVTQMVSEAVRFRYIQKQVMSNPEFKPNPKFISLQNNWDRITDCFETAELDGSFQKKEIKNLKRLTDENGNPWEPKKVSDISSDIGLLKHIDPKKCKVKEGNDFQKDEL